MDRLRLTRRPARLLAPLAGLLGLLLLAACGGGGEDDANTVRVQLDWTPNTNHIGIYIAQAKGWYRDAGVKLQILPYSDGVNPDTLVANGQADIGISFPANVIFSRAAGLDIVSVAAVLQSRGTALVVLDSSDIKRPRDMDGKTYAGFGLPFEDPQIKTVIRSDGGKGEFQTATLNTAAYEALYAKRADFTEVYTAWEGIEAELRGIKLRSFRYEDYGVPDFPGVVLVAKRDNVARRADVLRRFLEATRRGYELAAQQPAEAARVFMDAVPKGTFPEPELVPRSTAMLASIYLRDGGWGRQDTKQWDAYSAWLLASGVVVDDKGRPVSQLSGGPLYTNELLDGAQTRAP